MDPKAPRLARLPQEGDDARSTGKADQNESVSSRERSGEPLSDVTDGPIIGAAGEYKPARYPQTHTNDKGVSITVLREDR